jgi:hypothetical protein
MSAVTSALVAIETYFAKKDGLPLPVLVPPGTPAVPAPAG